MCNVWMRLDVCRLVSGGNVVEAKRKRELVQSSQKSERRRKRRKQMDKKNDLSLC